MNKMKFETADLVEKNIDKIALLFPNCITEMTDENGHLKKAVNFELLRQMLSKEVAEGAEAYEFTWVGKKAAIAEANRPIRKTLRPCREDSINWDTTENLYIEGDNLEVLKLLQESYLGKVKMIYIDPPYNTGNDFIYNDNFKMTLKEYADKAGGFDDEDNCMFKNTDSSGRFHSDWCSMIYSRLMLARNLLSNDGIICISMDDNEDANLKNICDEIFGHSNRIGEIIRKTKSMTADNGNGFNLQHEILLIYAKNIFDVYLTGEEKTFSNYSNPDNDPNGVWCAADPSAKSGGESTSFGIENPYTHRIDYPPNGRYWAFSKQTLQTYIDTGRVKFKKVYGENERGFIFKRYKNNMSVTTEPVNSLFGIENEYMNQAATIEVKRILGGDYFSYPKPVAFIKKLIKYSNADIVLDFFSGSATTAHAVMELNAEDGGHRKFIMVQIPEKTDEKSKAYKAGYSTICEIGKERIRRTAENIAVENPNAEFDNGFRVFKLDDTNMKDVYYAPDDYNQTMLDLLESNVKDDRTGLDLFFGCLLEWGLPLSMPYTSEEIDGCTIHTCNGGDLIACFDNNIPDSVVKTIAKRQPLRAVFRDSGFADSPSKINVSEVFKLLAPDTRVKVI